MPGPLMPPPPLSPPPTAHPPPHRHPNSPVKASHVVSPPPVPSFVAAPPVTTPSIVQQGVQSSSSSSSSSSTTSLRSTVSASLSSSRFSSSLTFPSSSSRGTPTPGSGTSTSTLSLSSLSRTSSFSSSSTSSTSSISVLPGSNNAPTNQGSSTNTKSHSSTATIVGGLIGGLAVALITIILLFLFCRRQKQRPSRDNIPDTILDTTSMAEITSIVETASGGDRHQAAVIASPFIHTSLRSTSTAEPFRFELGSWYRLSSAMTPSSPSGHTAMPSMYTMPSRYSAPSATWSDNESAYDGYVEPSSLDNNIPPIAALASAVLLVSSSEHLMTNDGATPQTPVRRSDDIESTRRVRQTELDQRLQEVQQEMIELQSDVSSIEKGTRAPQTPSATGEAGIEEEMNISDMREQIRRMRAQIAFLQDQRRSAWALGLTDDPPPGYTRNSSS